MSNPGHRTAPFRRNCNGSAAADIESTTRPAFRDTRLGPKEQ